MAGRTWRVLRNTGIQTLSQGITWSLSWILLVMLPRALGDSGFGRLFFAISYGALFSTLINLGVNTFLVREVAVLRPDPELPADERARRLVRFQALLGNTLALKLVLALVVFLLQSAVIYLLPYDDQSRQMVVIIGLGTCLGAVTQTLGGAFQGLEQMLPPNLALILEKLIVTGGCAWMLHAGAGIIPVCWVYTLASAAAFALQFVLLRRQVPFGLAWDRPLLRRIFVGGIPFLIWAICSEIYIRVDVMMLSLMTSDAVVGWYGAATRLYGTLLFVPNILMTAVFPSMMRLGAGQGDDAAFAQASERLLNLLLFVAIPISAGVIVIAGPLTLLLYGPGSFANAVAPLQILGVSILLVCVDVVLGTVLIARGREKAWAYMAIAAACFNPLLNVWVIPLTERLFRNGGIGAAVSTLLTEVLMMVGALCLMPRGIFSRRNLVCALKGVAVALAMILLLTAWGTRNLPLLIAGGAAWYLPLALAFGVIPWRDVAHLRHALRHREG
jgi:O-antigen/teichoic acid export membrane protein